MRKDTLEKEWKDFGAEQAHSQELSLPAFPV